MPYGNKNLHFGHVGGVFVPADFLARFLRDRIGRENVIFVSGTDCYGSPIMAGEYDVVLPCETRRIAGAIAGARLVIVPGADHVLPKVAPDVVTDELLATIESAERAYEDRTSRAATPWET